MIHSQEMTKTKTKTKTWIPLMLQIKPKKLQLCTIVLKLERVKIKDSSALLIMPIKLLLAIMIAMQATMTLASVWDQSISIAILQKYALFPIRQGSKLQKLTISRPLQRMKGKNQNYRSTATTIICTWRSLSTSIAKSWTRGKSSWKSSREILNSISYKWCSKRVNDITRKSGTLTF